MSSRSFTENPTGFLHNDMKMFKANSLKFDNIIKVQSAFTKNYLNNISLIIIDKTKLANLDLL